MPCYSHMVCLFLSICIQQPFVSTWIRINLCKQEWRSMIVQCTMWMCFWMSCIICVSWRACNHHDQHPLSLGLEALSLLVSCYIVGQTGLYVCVFALCWLFQCFPLGLFLLVDSQVYHHQCSQGLVCWILFRSCIILGQAALSLLNSCFMQSSRSYHNFRDISLFNHRGFCFFASLIGWAQ